ncbi:MULTISPECIES: hypothetical protein [unclassified Caballeronia]|uniref:hypothetical protein n=1 Tax=unclassified Caballeronia TaxID=2646786 RepID=UPI0028570D81|nr:MULTISPECIES: hypothetical protein [unclassified Caballeronia]MDR5771499.1 hypothetical protein [Caballeronia sp. LZ002]MDR5805260.1 hypothetical protein [Caballeronia sp. LZ001]MDR5846935.1 hypothetical protein [Caballeronia sp. LZ003]
MDQRRDDEVCSTRELLIEDLAVLGIGAGVLATVPKLSSPPRTVESDQAEAAAMRELRPLLRDLSKRGRYVAN